MTDRPFDQEKSDAFADRIRVVVNDAALALMVSVGHRVGLFDTMACLSFATSGGIADAAGLNERYVREWLAAMVTGRVVEYDRDRDAYRLPPEHAAKLTRAAGYENWAVQAQYIPLGAHVEDSLVECFRTGGGIPYSAYPRLQQIMSEDTGAALDAMLVDGILPLVPDLPGRVQASLTVADIGCGHGRSTNLMASAFPSGRFVGYDISEDGLAMGRVEADKLGLGNVRFEMRDVAAGIPGRFDLITTFDTIHDLAQPERVLGNIAAALEPDGVFLMTEYAASSYLDENVDHPMGPLMYTASCTHCVPVSMGLGGPGLGAMWGEQEIRQMLADAGFTNVAVKKLDADSVYSHFICAKD